MRLLMVLEGHRFVQKSAESGLYRLGLKLFELWSKAVAQFGLTERARPYLERFVSGTGETAYLSVLDGGEALVLERVESSRAVRVPTSVGWRHLGFAEGIKTYQAQYALADPSLMASRQE